MPVVRWNGQVAALFFLESECMSYEEEDTCMAYEEEDACLERECTMAKPPATAVRSITNPAPCCRYVRDIYGHIYMN